MADQESFTPVRVSARDIPPPVTISPEAQKALSDGTQMPRVNWPPAADKDAWRAQIEAGTGMREQMAGPILAAARCSRETVQIAGVTCYDCVPEGAGDGPVYLYIHGGFVFGGGILAEAMGVRTADSLGVRVISVDYRMPPDHPYPAAPDDCLAVHKALIETIDPSRIVIGGASAAAIWPLPRR